ncbi:DUF2851 family protein [Crocinitomix algicola]|uniref:DUF2851 family protein n=1 Tax=Crocinitomix algicola TaxID=1740263 RepID=UPI000873100C|nr:DUF2851 family protein [Crocinitomix algicola]
MNEEYLHYVYDKRMLGDTFETVDGHRLDIIEFGTLNKNAGPDFLDAKIRLNGNVWYGAIEFHIYASDWYRHGHQHDAAYNAVIAHFVLFHDREVFINNSQLPAVAINSLIQKEHLLKYQGIISNQSMILCESQLNFEEKIDFKQAIEESIQQRLWRKSIKMIQLIEEVRGDRLKAFIIAIARVFGGKVNQIPFETLGKSLTINFFSKLNFDEFRVSALVLGVSGLIPEETNDKYCKRLKQEFHYQKHLFNLTELPKVTWRYSRMRPNNFPDRRLAEFALMVNQLLYKGFDVEGNWSIKDFYAIFQVDLPEFWARHYRFKNQSKKRLNKKLSKSLLDLILINAVVPYIYALGIWQGEDELTERAIEILKKILPEKNGIISKWKTVGIPISSAYESQGLIELMNEGCKQKKCLFCNVGKTILKVEV